MVTDDDRALVTVPRKLFTEKSARNMAYSHQNNEEVLVVESTEIYIQENSTQLSSITTILNYCKSKILNPYLRILSIMGLRPLIYEQLETCVVLEILNYCYTVFIIILMILGYILQYMACFRRDRGFCQNGQYEAEDGLILQSNDNNSVYSKTCDGSLFFSFIIPSCLHFFGYLHALFTFRSCDDDQLPILMERVFLCSSNLPNAITSQKRLVKTLWIFVIFSILWMLASLASVNYMMAVDGNIRFKWVDKEMVIAMKVLLIVSTLWNDAVQATIVSNYCLQAQLLTSYLQFLREKLLQYPIEPLLWMRDIEAFKKMLSYFNREVAPSVCLFTIVNVSCAAAGLLWLFNFDQIDRETLPIMGFSILNVILWMLIAAAPFIQAARLSNACDVLRSAGQEVRTRPFVHQDTPSYELDAILMYTASLQLSAQLFYLPITGKYLCFLLTLSAIVLLVLGQCHFLLSQ